LSLPPLLRLIVFTARQIVGDVECDLIRVSIDGRKVSFLRYPDFDRVPHPELNYSVKVCLPKAAHRFRYYADSTNPPLVHRKEALLNEMHSDFLALRGIDGARGCAGPPVPHRYRIPERLARRSRRKASRRTGI
jgi:DNA phosphorothioation-associated putative methyltransferase